MDNGDSVALDSSSPASTLTTKPLPPPRPGAWLGFWVFSVLVGNLRTALSCTNVERDPRSGH